MQSIIRCNDERKTDVRVVSERFTSEADAQRAKRTILMMYPTATVRIEKTDETGRAK
jgi:hypothetical protein